MLVENREKPGISFENQQFVKTSFSWGFACFHDDFDKSKAEVIMGGYGSTRWGWHTKKHTVEDCRKLTIYFLKPYLNPQQSGLVTWRRGGWEIGSISYCVTGDDAPEAIRLVYTIGAKSENPQAYDYPVELTTSALPWGGVRYWFICPTVGCGRQVGALYLAPGGQYFACRHCNQLAYESQQESQSFALYDFIAAEMQEHYPGITTRDVKAMLNEKTTPHLRQLQQERFIRFWDAYQTDLLHYKNRDWYLSGDDLCEQSGLQPDNLARLESARLLLPDTKDRRYRPKLVGWACKLAYLINEGWTIDEIRAWAKGRWKAPNPRQWPPEHKDYFLRSCDKLSTGECA